jgi:uncharacterized protein (DUF983 family)
VKEIQRALRLRCPNCGEGKLLDSWIRMKPACESCTLRLDRGEHDYFIGAYTLNLIATELIVVAGIVAGMLLTWPDVPWNVLKWVLLPVAVLAPLATLPFARSLWLANVAGITPRPDGRFRLT